ncbi:hypothetical protein Trydic_g8256 [Trypoxylus dichotomus]
MRGKKLTRNVSLQHDNTPMHTARITEAPNRPSYLRTVSREVAKITTSNEQRDGTRNGSPSFRISNLGVVNILERQSTRKIDPKGTEPFVSLSTPRSDDEILLLSSSILLPTKSNSSYDRAPMVGRS